MNRTEALRRLISLAALAIAIQIDFQSWARETTPQLIVVGRNHVSRLVGIVRVPDDNYISASVDGTLRIWDSGLRSIETLRPPLNQLQGGGISTLSQSSDGKTVAFATLPKGVERTSQLHVMRTPDRKLVGSWVAHAGEITSICFSPDGLLVVTASNDKSAKLWRVSDGALVATLADHPSAVVGTNFSPDGKIIVTLCNSDSFRIWSTAGKQLIQQKVSNGQVGGGFFASNSKLVTASTDGSVQIWQLASNGSQLTRLEQISLHEPIRGIVPLNESRDRILCLTGGLFNGVVKPDRMSVVDLTTGQSGNDWDFLTSRVRFLSPVLGSRVLIGDEDGGLHEYAIDSGQRIRTIHPESSPIRRIYLSKQQPFRLQFSSHKGATHEQIIFNRGFDLSVGISFAINHGQLNPRDMQEAFGRRIFKNKNQEVFIKTNGRDSLFLNFDERGRHGSLVYTYALLGSTEAIVSTNTGLYLFDSRTGEETGVLAGHVDAVGDISLSKDGRFFATCSLDQTIKFWNSHTKAMFATLFVSGNDWIMWTPEGYYACSPDGERLIAWQIDHSPNEFAEILPAVRFATKLYRPEIVRRAFELADSVRAIQQLGASSGGVAFVLPPDVNIVSPTNSSSSDGDSVVIKATAKARANNPISWLELKVNDCTARDVHGQSRRPANESTEFNAEWEIKLDPGKELKINVVAHSSRSGTESVSNTVLLKNSRPSAQPLFGTLHLIAVGIGEYQQYSHLSANKDAQLIADRIERQAKGIFAEVRKRVLLEDEVSDENLRQAFAEVRELKGNSDLAVVYFAGHGDKDAEGNYNFLYRNCPRTQDPGKLLALSVSELEHELKDLCPVFLMLDTCEAGSLLSDASRIFARGHNVVTFASSRTNQQAIESSSLGMSYFAHAVNEALNGKARLDTSIINRPVLYSVPLVKFVENEVCEMSKDNQQPFVTWGANINKNFPIAIVDPAQN